MHVCAGLTSLLPDCLMLCVHARDGVNRTTQEHLAAALALDIPVFAVVTQADTATPEALQATVRATRTLLATAADTAAFARPSPADHSTDDASDAELPPAASDASARGDIMFAIDDDQVRRPGGRIPVPGPLLLRCQSRRPSDGAGNGLAGQPEASRVKGGKAVGRKGSQKGQIFLVTVKMGVWGAHMLCMSRRQTREALICAGR